MTSTATAVTTFRDNYRTTSPSRSVATCLRVVVAALVLMTGGSWCRTEERRESFDREPDWEGHNNRAVVPAPREVRQDFGYSATRHAGGARAGEIGGWTTPAAETAYYAKPIERATLKDRLTASGTLACGGRQFHVLIGFFNSRTIDQWRAPNSLFLRLYGRGDVYYAYVEYATARCRAGGDSPGGFATIVDPDTGQRRPRGFATGDASHRWSIDYDPEGNGGGGSLTVTIGDETAVCFLDPGHKQDGATFDRFGLLAIPKSVDQGGDVWLDDVSVNGRRESFDEDPGWEEVGNRRVYTTRHVRPRFDFGFSPTRFAGGRREGELGGVVFRGDCRDPNRLAYYGDRLKTLTLDSPLRASGKVALRRGVSDSTVLLGYFHSRRSVEVSSSQASGFPVSFLGVAIEGPSREGFQFYPVCRTADGEALHSRDERTPHILTDGRPADWTLRYEPGGNGEPGRLTVTYDGRSQSLEVPRGGEKTETRFDRFGIVTTWIDGNSQTVFFDDLTYTCGP